MTTPAADADMGDLGFGDAMSELESILTEIEGDGVDVDQLAAKVRRAADLIRLARSRITEATVEVDRIVSELEE